MISINSSTEPALYLNICILCSFGVFIEITFERFLQATGRTIYSMITQLVGAITNIILDPILIFGLLGFPMRMGGSVMFFSTE